MANRGMAPACRIAALPVSLPVWSLPAWADPLPGTKPLVIDQPLDVIMVDGIDRFALRETALSVASRAALWNRDYSSREAYEKSAAPNREHLRAILGAVDRRSE